MREIKLTQNKITIVSDEDFDYLNQFKWYADTTNSTPYAKRGNPKSKTGAKIRMHRNIMERIIGRELKRKELVDHIDGNGLNNTRENLRIVTARQNQQNRQYKTTSKYPGVSWYKRTEKWQTVIQYKGQDIHLGYSDSEEEAYQKYFNQNKELKLATVV